VTCMGELSAFSMFDGLPPAMARNSLRPMNRMFLMENGSSPCQQQKNVFLMMNLITYQRLGVGLIETKMLLSVFAISRICASHSDIHAFPFSRKSYESFRIKIA